MPGKLILVRHGQSTWNLENLFTGWTDVDLSAQGRGEAPRPGRELLEERLAVDIAFTSVLKRAIRTLWIMLDEMDRMWMPVERSWRLNERHYGALQGLDKAQTVAQHGEAQVKIWRRSYDIPPPPLAPDDERHPRFDPRYAGVAPQRAARDRVAQGHARARAALLARAHRAGAARGRNVMVVAHGNSLRAMVKMLDDVSESDIVELNIPTGVPLLYELDAELRPRGQPLPGRPGRDRRRRRSGEAPDRKALTAQRWHGGRSTSRPAVIAPAELAGERRQARADVPACRARSAAWSWWRAG